MSSTSCRLRFARAVCVLASVVPVFACAQESDRPLLLTGAKVLDRNGERLLSDRVVLIEANRIKEVSTMQDDNGLAEATRVDLSELTLLPGLIDLHSHLLLHPYDEASWNDQVLKESLELRTIRAAMAAKATLESGFTTIRDLGTEGAGYADVALRDAVNQGIITGPRRSAGAYPGIS